jgi:cytochrome c556
MRNELFFVLFVAALVLVIQGCGSNGRQAAPSEKPGMKAEESGAMVKVEGTDEELEEMMEGLKEKMGVIKYAADTGKNIDKVPAAAMSIAKGISGIRSFKPEKNEAQIEEFYQLGEKLSAEANDIVEFLKKEGAMEEQKTYLAGKMEALGSTCGACHDKFRK